MGCGDGHHREQWKLWRRWKLGSLKLQCLKSQDYRHSGARPRAKEVQPCSYTNTFACATYTLTTCATYTLTTCSCATHTDSITFSIAFWLSWWLSGSLHSFMP